MSPELEAACQLAEAVFCYRQRRSGIWTPFGSDRSGVWLPDARERQVCCADVGFVKQAFPLKFYSHCKTAAHVAARAGVTRAELLGADKAPKGPVALYLEFRAQRSAQDARLVVDLAYAADVVPQ